MHTTASHQLLLISLEIFDFCFNIEIFLKICTIIIYAKMFVYFLVLNKRQEILKSNIPVKSYSNDLIFHWILWVLIRR